MPVIRRPDEMPQQHGPGWSRQAWAGPETFGTPVPMTAVRWRLAPGAACDARLGGQEALAFVIGGSGTARQGSEEFPLAGESLLWLAGCDSAALAAGGDGLDVLVAESTGGEPAAPLRKLFAVAELPHLTSTRDTRDRLDLVTENVPVGARQIRADRISYHPGDTSSIHSHPGSCHVFCVLTGSGLLYSGPQAYRLEAGMSALVGMGEEHWFENDRQEEFSFAEFWAPPPTETVWIVPGDRCTWAPVP